MAAEFIPSLVNPMILIAGCQRSGTTLTGQILGAHPQTFMIDEFDGLYPFLEQVTGRQAAEKEKLELTISQAAQKYTDSRRHCASLSDIAEFTLIAKAPNATYDYLHLQNYPAEIKVVFPVRHVCAVVASILALNSVPMVANQIQRLVRHPQLAQELADEITLLNSLETAEHKKTAMIWRIKTGMYQRFTEHNFEVCRFRYEDLIQHPEASVREILRCCRLAWNDSVLLHSESMQGQGPGNTSRTRSIDSASLSKWRSQLSAEECRDILAIAAPLMATLGY